MGSGETSPTMVELHKSLLRSTGGISVLDTPYGFQENADELTAKALIYFADSVGVVADVISLRTADLPPRELGVGLAALGAARYVFAGPGSPTYALEQWKGLGVRDLFVGVVERGGVVTLASAASICAGALSLPVYELYKVGQAPYWEQGLDLLGHFGLNAIVVPHFNNTEGGTHDTSCCYVGRHRLDVLRRRTPDVPVLGIDEHTALVIDPVARTAKVHGLSAAHVLKGDIELRFPTGTTFNLDEALSVGNEPAPQGTVDSHRASPSVPDAAAQLRVAVEAQDADAVISALVELAGADPATSATLAALESVLASGWTDPTQPYADLLLESRRIAREHKVFALSDVIRDGLAALGLVVEDTADGQRLRRT